MEQLPGKRYEYEKYSMESKRVINQLGVRAAMPDMEEAKGSNACWDAIVAPDGRLYYPLSSEHGLLCATKLGWFDYENEKVEVCFDTEDVLLSHPRKLPHSKFHTSMNIIPRSALYPEVPYDEKDYLIIATTHSTDRGRTHPEFLVLGHFNHVWEGFPGSQIIVFDPKTNRGMTLGTPVPQETIYGAKYDPKHNRLYMIGFIRGHVYCYDLNERRVIKDLGKAAEIFTYRLVLGGDGHIYGMSKSGQLFKINTDTVELENMEFHVPETSAYYHYIVQGRNHPSNKNMYFAVPGRATMYKLEYATGEVTELGAMWPKDGLFEGNRGSVKGFDFDKDGVMWIALLAYGGFQPPYDMPYNTYLVRWNPDKGEAPYCCGLLGKVERLQQYVTEVEYDPLYDRLYWVDQVSGEEPDRPSCGGVDLKIFREHYKERGPVTNDERAFEHLMTEDQLERYNQKSNKDWSGEENSADNPYHAAHPSKVEAIRIWRSIPRLEVEDSKVIGMAFDKKSKDYRYKIHAVCGRSGCFDTAAFVLEIVDGVVTSTKRFSEIDETYKAWLRTNILPQPVAFDENIKLPEATGRRFRAKASCVIDWKDGKKFVGTMDALAAIVSPDGTVFSLGNAAAYGPIRSMCTNKAKTHLWGVASDDDDLGYVFQYDDVNGLRQMGILNYNLPGYFNGPSCANVLSSINLSPCEKYLAVGGCDRIASIHVIKLD